MFDRSSRADEVSITGKMTVSEGQQHLVDPEASLRAELTGAIAAAQIEVANAIAELSRSGAEISALTNQNQALQDLQRMLSTANLGGLFALRNEVASATTNASAIVSQATFNAANSGTATASLLQSERARAAITALHGDLFERRVLDPYLQFDSLEDEEAYRKRELEREAEIRRALELRTPEGDRRAADLVQDQLRDAGAHGADRSPDFAGMVQRADAAMADLRPLADNPSPANVGAQAELSEGQALADDGLSDILATLRAAGVTTPAIQSSDAGHGVALTAVQAREGAAPVRQG